MNILNKLTLRSLKLNRKRTAVTIIGIILSGAMICGVATIAASFQDLLVQSAIETDGNFHATFYDVRPEQVKYITDNPYTETAMLSRDIGFAWFEGSENDRKPYMLVKEYDSIAFASMPVKLKEGRFPENNGEIVISEEIFLSGGTDYAIGRIVTLDLGRRNDQGTELQSEPYSDTETFEPLATKTYTITGFIDKPRFEMISAVPGYTVIAYLEGGGFTAAGPVNVSILGKNLRTIFDKVPELAGNAGVEQYTYNSEHLKWLGVSRNDNFNSLFNGVVLIIILLVVVGSVTVIYNAFAISVSERKKQFGMLASIGATPRQIRKTVFFEGVILGLVGIPVGILSGIGGIGVTLSVVNDLLIGSMFSENISLRMVVSPAVILVTVLFVALVIFLSAFIPANRAAAIAPIDAIRLSTDIQIKGKQLRTSRVTRFLFGVEGELALKNLKRNRRRYRATVLSLLISIVLFVSFSSFMTYGFRSTDMYYGDIPYDVVAASYNATIEEQKEFFAQIVALEDVERYASIRTIHSSADGLEPAQLGAYIRDNFVDEEGKFALVFTIVGLNEQAFELYAQETGLNAAIFKDTEQFKGILINRNIIAGAKYVEYEPVNMKAGETLQLLDYQYGDEHQPAELEMEIGAITDKIPFGLTNNNLAVSMIVTEGVFEAIRARFHEITRMQADQAHLYIKSKNSADLVENIRNIYGKNDDHSLFVQDIAASGEEMKRSKTVMAIFLYGFVTLITLIGVTNIFNTISTNVALRRREFAVLKSVGLTPKGFNRILNYESIFYGLKALAFGLPAGILISVWMYNAFGDMFEFAFILPWKEIAASVAGVFIIVSITMMHSSARLKRENIIDALREENL